MGEPRTPARIAGITLDEHTVVRRSPDIEHERAVAIFDLLEENHFAPVSGCAGPFHLHLAIEENRLSIEIRSMANGSNETIVLPLAPFRGIVKDYFMVCESYYEAIRRSSLAQIEAIDVGRRSLAQRGVRAADRAARRQGRDRPRHGPAPVHADLRAASAGVTRGDGAAPRARLRLAAPARTAAPDRASCPTASIRPISTRPRAAASCRRLMRCASPRKRRGR